MTINLKNEQREAHLEENQSDQIPAWEQIEPGRFQPRRIRGSDRGRKLG